MGDDVTARVVEYSEGDVFRVVGFILGVVTRTGSGVACCHFFTAAELEHINSSAFDLDPVAAAAVLRVDDEPLRTGVWPIVGRIDRWSRERWPMPPFGVHWPGISVASLSIYSDDDAAMVVDSNPTDLDSARASPPDHIHSSRQVEIVLTGVADTPIEELAGDLHATSDLEGDSDKEIRAFFLLSGEVEATAIERSLTSLGWETHRHPTAAEERDETVEWQVVASKYFSGGLDHSELEALRSSLEECAELHRGVMDGWELEV